MTTDFKTNHYLAAFVRWAQPRFNQKHKLHPGRLALAAAWRAAIGTIPYKSGFRRSLYGVWLADRSDDLTFRFCLKGTYGFGLSNYLAAKREPFVFLDIGSNVGLYALLASTNSNCLQVHAFEPDPVTLQYLIRNGEYAGSGIIVHPYAIDDSPGMIALYRTPQHSGAASLTPRDSSSQSVEAIAVDSSYLDGIEFGRTGDVVCKVDVEGHEMAVLASLQRAKVWRQISAVWIEVSEGTATKILELLQQNGFAQVCVYGEGTRWDVLYERTPV